MAKLTYLELVNRILRRITQTPLTDINDATGQATIICDLLNEGQLFLATSTNWYSLYASRKWSFVSVTGSSNISFANGNPDTISGAASAFANFVDGQRILVSGTTSNNGLFTIGKAFNGGVYNSAKEQSRNLRVKRASNTTVTVTADYVWLTASEGRYKATAVNETATITTSGVEGLDTGTEANSTLYYVYLISNGNAVNSLLSTSSTSPTLPTGYVYKTLVGTVFNGADGHFVDNVEGAASALLTLQSEDSVTAESNTSAVITAITYPVPEDWGRTITLVDTTNDRVLIEDNMRSFDEQDPQLDVTGDPTHFAVSGNFYRLWPIGTSGTVYEQYYKIPARLVANDDVSDLPIEAENALIYYALKGIAEYQNKFDISDRRNLEFKEQLKVATVANKNKINKMVQIGSSSGFIEGVHGITPARLPLSYPRGS